MESYDAGLLNDFGGGDIGWWQDYIRAELNRAEDFYREQYDRLTAQLADANRGAERNANINRALAEKLAERDAEIARLQQQSVGWVAVFDENAALREEVERLKAVKTPPRIVHAQHCAVNSYSGRPNKCTCGLEG